MNTYDRQSPSLVELVDVPLLRPRREFLAAEQVLDLMEEVAHCARGRTARNSATDTVPEDPARGQVGVLERGDLVDERGFDGGLVRGGERGDGALEVAGLLAAEEALDLGQEVADDGVGSDRGETTGRGRSGGADEATGG